MKQVGLYALMRTGFPVKVTFTIAFLALVACSCFKADAQTNSTSNDTVKKYQLQQVQIWSGLNSLSTSSPTPAQIIKGKALERLSSFSVADAIRYFSGAQIKDYGGIGGLKTVDVRSLGSSQVAVFYDGVQLGNAQNGQVDLGKFSLDNIGEIELYNAQKSTIFQPARGLAAGSSVYLTAKRPIFPLGSSNKLNTALRIGSLGLINPSLTWQHKLSDRVYSSISTEFVRATGRYKFRATNGIYDTTAVRNNGDIDALRLEAGVNGVLRDSSTWSVKTYLYNSERGLPGAILSNRFNYNQREWDRNIFIQSGYERRGKLYSLMTQAKYSNDYLRYLDPEIITATGFSDSRYHQQEVYLSLVNQFAINSIWNIAVSTDYQRNTMQANIERFSYPTRHLLLGGLATQLKWSKLNIQANVLGSFLNESTRMFDTGRNYTKYTPAILASWQPFKHNLFGVRGFYKALYRLPTFNELYYTVVGNANLNPEYSQQYNIGFTFQKFNADKILRLLSIQTDVYHNDVNNKIVAIPSQNLRRWTMLNIGSVIINGAETNIKAGWQLTNDIYLNTGISYTYQRARDVTPSSILNQQIPYTPVNSGSLIAGVLWHQMVLNYSFIYTGERYNQKENSTANYVEPWYTHDLSVIWQITSRARQVKLGLDVNNLFNQYYEVIANFPMPGRYYRFKISYNY